VIHVSARWAHLARRFFGALDPRGPSDEDEAWVAERLGEGEQELWARMSGPDRRHAVGVARAVAATPDGAQTWVVAAALLHDVGKVDSQLSTLARVPATLVGLVARERAAAGEGRLARYLRHDAIGADLLARAGADPRTVAWAREHHQPSERWTVPMQAGATLKAADDD
jgi:hypothetical protein